MNKTDECRHTFNELTKLTRDCESLLNSYRRSLTEGSRLGSNHAEIFDRFRQLRQLQEIVCKHQLEFIVALERQVAASSGQSAHVLHLHVADPSSIGDSMKTFVEAWYYFAHRIKVATNEKGQFPNIKKFSPTGVTIVRNKLIEHRSPLDSLGNYGVSVVNGLFFGSGQSDGALSDKGFIPNAFEFLRGFSEVISASIQKTAIKEYSPSLRKSGGAAWEPVSNESVTNSTQFNEANTSTLTIPKLTLDMDGCQYRVIAFNSVGMTVSIHAVLTVHPEHCEKLPLIPREDSI